MMNKKPILISIVLVIGLVCISLLLGNIETGEKTKERLSRGEGVVTVGDIDIGYKTYGEGDPLILIMGYGSTMNMWEEQLLEALSADHQVIIFDNRGMGETSAGNKDFTIAQFAEDTNGLMAALKIKKADVLGWSMGSYIAQELALNHPERINKLVLYASAASPEMFPSSPEVLAKLQDTSGTPEEQGARWISVLFSEAWLNNNGERIKEIFYRPMGSMNPENIGKQSMAIGKWAGTTDRLGTIKCATLIIDGQDDVLVPSANAYFLHDRIANSKLVLVDQAGHGLMFQEPGDFAEIVTNFFKQGV